MKRFLAILAIAVSLARSAAADPTSTDPTKMKPGVYELDARHASLVVKIAHMGGFSRYTMRFNRLKGGFTLAAGGWQNTKVTIDVDPTSVDTGNPSFNKTIAGYFDAATYKTITFVGQSVTPTGDTTGKLAGDLTFHGVTKPVTLDVTFNGFGPGLLGLGTRVGFSGTGRIKRSEFGVNAVNDVSGDDVDLIFEAEFVKQ